MVSSNHNIERFKKERHIEHSERYEQKQRDLLRASQRTTKRSWAEPTEYDNEHYLLGGEYD